MDAHILGLGTFIITIIFFVWLGFMLSLSRLVDVVKTEEIPKTNISKVWVWTQIIPIWGFIALIIYNIKMNEAVRALEDNLKLPIKSITYPAFYGWIVILGIAYTWIPVVGYLVLILSMILFWVKVISTYKQIESLKT